MCFDKKKQKNVEMRLMYELFKIEIARVYLCYNYKIKIFLIVIKQTIIRQAFN